MNPNTPTKAYVRRLMRTAAKLDLHPFFLDALVNQLVVEKDCSRENFLQAYFLRLAYQATEEAHQALQSDTPNVRVRAAASLAGASLFQLGRLSEAQQDLLFRCQPFSRGRHTIKRLHLELLNTACADLQKQMERFNAASFPAFLGEGLGSHVKELRHLRHRMQQQAAANTEDAPGNGLLEEEALLSPETVTPITLMLADGMTLIRQALRELLVRQPHNGFTVIGEAATGRDLMALLKNAQPDVVIIDVNTPQPNGIDTTEQIRLYYPDVKVLALSNYKSPVEVELVVRAGATGFIGTDAAVEELFQAIRTVHAGEAFFGTGVPTRLLA